MAKLLKNLYDENYITTLGNNISCVYPRFEKDKFRLDIFNNEWEYKELKQRMRHISTTIGKNLSLEYSLSIEILKKAFLKMPEDKYLENMIFQDFVEVYGLEEFDISYDALECFTQNSSSEFAIRQFILKDENKTMNQMKHWAKQKSEHTRRLATEGCRSRLPWAISLNSFKKDPSKIIEILNILKYDTSKYVQKSIANNLNDISKDNPAKVKQIAKNWIGESKSIDWIVKHGCRTLLKDGDIEVLNTFGFLPLEDIEIKDIKVSKEVFMGNSLNFSFNLTSKKKLGKLRIEYAITFARLNGKSNRKVFKICEGEYKENHLNIIKQYSFKKITTRKYYVGKHTLEIIVNGVSLDIKEFDLLK